MAEQEYVGLSKSNIKGGEDCKDVDDTIQMLRKSLEDAHNACDIFFDNHYEAACQMVAPLANTSIFHSLINVFLHSSQAILTYQQADFEAANQSIKVALDLCNKRKKHDSITNKYVTQFIWKPNYNNYTEEEIHVELIMAECLLAKAVLTIIQDESLIAVLKSGFAIRACYMTYKKCDDILKRRQWPDEVLKMNFKSGVLLGLGAFNLIISGFPAKVHNLLKFVGFSGNKEVGKQMLEESRNMQHCLRGDICSFFILTFHTLINFLFGSGDVDVEYCESVLQSLQTAHPNGSVTLILNSRIEVIKGNIKKAIKYLGKSMETQNSWTHVIYWELAWCYIVTGQWTKSQQCLELIVKESLWSKTLAKYMLASVMSMRKDLSEDEQEQIEELMRTAKSYRIRLAGKSMPMEKFLLRRAARYEVQNKWLFLSVQEAMYHFNYFVPVRTNTKNMTELMEYIEQAISNLEAGQSQTHYYCDNLCLGLFLQGVCLRHLRRYVEAQKCFERLLKSEKKIKEDKHLVPYARMELGYMFLEMDNTTEARHHFEMAKTFKNYSMESRIQIRVESGLNEIMERRATTDRTDLNNE